MMKTLLTAAKAHGKQAVSGLTVGAVIWIYATFATKSELQQVKDSNKAQWRVIAELRVQVGMPPGTNVYERPN